MPSFVPQHLRCVAIAARARARAFTAKAEPRIAIAHLLI